MRGGNWEGQGSLGCKSLSSVVSHMYLELRSPECTWPSGYVAPMEKALSARDPRPSDMLLPVQEGCEAWEGKPGSLSLRPNDRKLLKY